MNYIEKLNNIISQIKIEGLSNPGNFFPIFIVGAPRSGTTLIYQAIVSALNVGYPTNFIARFWGNPVIGLALQKEIYPNTNFISSFESTHGFSDSSALEPHEFGYFWSRWFDHSLNHYSEPETLIAGGLKKEISAIMSTSYNNWCFKNLTIGLKILLIKKIFPSAKFIVVNRKPHDVAISILQGRQEKFDDINRWWSLIPKEIESINKLSPQEQVVAQIYYTYNQINSDLKNIPHQDYHHVTYKNFCDQPNKSVKELANKFNLEFTNILPEQFKYSSSPPNEEIKIIVRQYFPE